MGAFSLENILMTPGYIKFRFQPKLTKRLPPLAFSHQVFSLYLLKKIRLFIHQAFIEHLLWAKHSIKYWVYGVYELAFVS